MFRCVMILQFILYFITDEQKYFGSFLCVIRGKMLFYLCLVLLASQGEKCPGFGMCLPSCLACIHVLLYEWFSGWL